MRTALLDEVQDNIGKLETWGNEYKGGNARKFMGNPDAFALDNFVWLTMQENPGTFEIPGVILTGIRRYYSNAAVTIRKMTSKKGAAAEVDLMLTDTLEFRKNTVGALEADVLVLRKKLEGMDFQL